MYVYPGDKSWCQPCHIWSIWNCLKCVMACCSQTFFQQNSQFFKTTKSDTDTRNPSFCDWWHGDWKGYRVHFLGTNNKLINGLESPFIRDCEQNFPNFGHNESTLKMPACVCYQINVILACTFSFTIHDNMLGFWMERNIQIAKTCPSNHDVQQA